MIEKAKRNKEIYMRYKSGEINSQMAIEYGVSRARILQIIHKFEKSPLDRKRPRLPKTDIDDIRKMTLMGKSAREIAEWLGCHPATIYRYRRMLDLVNKWIEAEK